MLLRRVIYIPILKEGVQEYICNKRDGISYFENYIIAHPQPFTGSTKGSGCLFPHIEGIIKSVVDWQKSIKLYKTLMENEINQLVFFLSLYDLLASETGTLGISSCSFNCTLNSKSFFNLVSDTDWLVMYNLLRKKERKKKWKLKPLFFTQKLIQFLPAFFTNDFWYFPWAHFC